MAGHRPYMNPALSIPTKVGYEPCQNPFFVQGILPAVIVENHAAVTIDLLRGDDSELKALLHEKTEAIALETGGQRSIWGRKWKGSFSGDECKCSLYITRTNAPDLHKSLRDAEVTLGFKSTVL